ncbi:MAG: endonuclease domain-containing protein [Rhizobiaceae bacterium]|nr:endonuclease domain-containing protein [Rhizobiaceae bacterium]
MTDTPNHGSSPPPSGGEVARAKPETERGQPALPSRRTPASIARARALRRGNNMAEATLWNELKARKLGGHKFVRQMPIGPYFADFTCRSSRLIVEIDGSQHAGSQYDRRRDAFMCSEGYSVLRMWNVDVLKDTEGVCATILAAWDGRLQQNTTAFDMRFVFAAASGGKA